MGRRTHRLGIIGLLHEGKRGNRAGAGAAAPLFGADQAHPATDQLYQHLIRNAGEWLVTQAWRIMPPRRRVAPSAGRRHSSFYYTIESSNIAVAPGAVWELPPDAKAYLLDLLQGGGVRLHADYIDLIYRTLHDLGESPRTAFGENRQGLSGVALNTELDPLLKKVQRKRLIRAAAYRRRNELILRVLERFTGESYAPYRTRVLWGPVLPQDRSRQVQDERVLVAAGIHSRRRAADALGVEDPESEFRRWSEEEAHIRSGMTNGAI
jgi:Phage portal protein, SPP1 Gp6-like